MSRKEGKASSSCSGAGCGWPALLGHGPGGARRTRVVVRGPRGGKEPLYIRGEGAGLSWKKGIKLEHVRANEWVWETWDPIEGKAEFKVLLNDEIYEEGPNHVLETGNSIEYTAKFPQ